MRRVATFILLFLALPAAHDIDVDKAFDDPELQARYETIIDEVEPKKIRTCKTMKTLWTSRANAKDLVALAMALYR